MTGGPSDQSIIQKERRVLQALCQNTPEGSVREAGKRLLENYHWRESLHRMIFEILMALPTGVPDLLASELPARLTRRGFPDVPTKDLFQPHGLSKAEAEGLMRELVDAP